MNDQQVYQLLAKKPNARAQDVCDALDVDMKVASERLRELVDVGDVARHTGLGPNGIQVQMYNLSDAFKRSPAGAALLAPATKASVVPPISAASTTMPPPQASKADRAVAHVQHGPATDDELRAVMGLSKGEYPSGYLNSAIKYGRIHKGEKGWTKGAAPGAAPFSSPRAKGKLEAKAQFQATTPVVAASRAVAADEAPVAPGPIKIAVVDDVFIASQDESKVEIAAAAVATPAVGPSSAVFRCGLWSDGVLELQRNGVQVACLTRGEGEHLAEFIGRVLVTVESTSLAGMGQS